MDEWRVVPCSGSCWAQSKCMRMNSSTSSSSASVAMGTKKGFQTGREEATVDGYGGEEIVGGIMDFQLHNAQVY